MNASNHSPSAVTTRRQRRRVLLAATLLAAGIGLGLALPASGAGEARAIPPFASDEPATAPAASETAVLAGGCFWGVQGVFQHVQGVTGAVSGYAGGDRATAVYETVASGRTGHAESVRITFDPRRISYARILQIYFSVAHDPTQLDRQGPDVGTQYRSAIFPVNAEQARIARAYIAQLEQAHVFRAPIVTRIEPDRSFYPAEDEHQDFLLRHPRNPYIVINDLPKIDDLARLFPELYRSEPVRVFPPS
ncbi:MAG: peptide-methionine (S)-S-oxide reductase MsrA [Burkholderiales bacterium]|nr:peptide-methionine (S)-S-oxide reductase MsrA [Burkholderiales bacterium]OJX05279.1 MAG: peptide-methionine (S)-S-oxide reductase [Burkholderiales bacterium 70-64]